MPSQYEEERSVPEFEEYVQNVLTAQDLARMREYYEQCNDSPMDYHWSFMGLLSFVEEGLRVHKIHREERGRPGTLDDDTMRFAIEAGLKSCASLPHDLEFAGSTGGQQMTDMLCLSHDLEILIDSRSEGHQLPARRTPPSQQQAGRNPAGSGYPRPGPRTRDLPDQRHGPPPSNSYRNSGPSRRYGRRQAPRGRYMEDSNSDDGDW